MSWLPLPPRRSMLRSSKSTAATALLSSLRAASRRTSQRSRSENAAGPTAPGYIAERSTFHFRQVPVILCSPCQACGAQLQHSRAPPPQTSERRTGGAARAAPALDEQRPRSLIQPILSSFSLCFWRSARSLYMSIYRIKVSSPACLLSCLLAPPALRPIRSNGW